MASVNEWRDQVERALLVIEDDILPFMGRRVTTACIDSLVRKATEVKRILQEGHLYLMANDPEEYTANLKDAVAENRRSLSKFTADLEEMRAAQQDAAAAAAREQVTAAAAADRAHRSAARQELVRSRVTRLLAEVKKLDEEGKLFRDTKPAGDEQLYECAEQHRVLVQRLDTAIGEGKAVAAQALDHDLIVEGKDVDAALACLHQLKLTVDQSMLARRKDAGVWAEKGRRAAARGDIKMPTFSGGSADRLTVYEFEKEWCSYKSAVNYSVEEALKELKMAVQPPARSAVEKLGSEETIFKYLKAHHGNPVLLLSAREAEMRGLSECKGTDHARREWLLHVKNRLEATVALCKEHNIEKYLHFSSVAGIVQSKLPYDMTRDFKKILVKHLSPSGVLEKELVIGLLIDFLDEKILDCTLGVNLDIVNFLGAAGDVKQDGGGGGKDRRQRGGKNFSRNQHGDGGGSAGGNGGGGASGQGGQDGGDGHKRSQHSQQQGGGGGGGRNKQIPQKCVSCGGEHPFLFYCEDYIKAKTSERFSMVKAQQTCGRCLTMGRKFTSKKSEWWGAHERYCRTTFFCKEGPCASKSKDRQLHMTICNAHATENQAAEPDFIRSLDPKELPAGFNVNSLRFLHMLGQAAYQHISVAAGGGSPFVDDDGFEIMPDVAEAAIFMMQLLPAEADPAQDLLCFYDSGCGAAGVSDRACELLRTKTVRPGPTVLDVAGAKSILIPYGDEQFHFELDGTKKKATFTGLRMARITAAFPVFQLTAAWLELQQAATRADSTLKLPAVDAEIGGQCVDVILGAKYFKYYPELVFSLPSGLAVYRAKLRSASGCQAVLGGPHAAWTLAAEQTQHMNPRAYLTMEARAWYVQQKWVQVNQDKFSVVWDGDDSGEDDCGVGTHLIVDQAAAAAATRQGCDHCHCGEAGGGMLYVSAVKEEKQLWKVEQLGTESPYRCISCRNCSKCRNGDTLEAISFKEEAEQALIEASVELDPNSNTLWATLPFIDDPVIKLQPNRFIAEKVFQSQLNLFRKNPTMREDTVKSHAKLLSRGHVIAEPDLPAEYAAAMCAAPGSGYFIPWRTVYNEGSLSTPCRIVFDASSKTPGGDSLNGVLAKGQNRLAKLQHLLVRFRRRAAAVTADISMAYNGTKLRPEHMKYQKYLWKEELREENPTIVMFVCTLIYGVRPSGQQCQVAIERLADFFIEKGECSAGAQVLKDDTYVDDILASKDTAGECQQTAKDIEKILAKGSMGVKAFSYSGRPPSELVSADGRHVGLAGYIWATEEDTITLDIGAPRLGRARRGKRPPPITGDFKTALRQNFTKRILTGLVAGVFDPLGLATPITAGLKLDLHQLCELNLDWDDPVPEQFLEKWAGNMEKIQQLRGVVFRRAVIPEDAVSTGIELLVATDASQHIGVVAVYGRVLRKNGLYSCQLLLGRSKILSGLTVPKAEMKSAVAAAVTASVVRRNLGDQYTGSLFITDSTICLFWISQDDRPLQLGVRNAVAEVRRFSTVKDWHHVSSEMNVADLGTRPASVAEIGPGSTWQQGQEWMWLPRSQMPIRTAAEVTLTAEEARVAAAELRAADVRGHKVHVLSSGVEDRYAYSNYLVDPCQRGWCKSVRIMAIVLIFVAKCKRAVADRSTYEKADPGSKLPGRAVDADPGSKLPGRTREQRIGRLTSLLPEEIHLAELYFFKKGTAEVLRFTKSKDYKNCSEMKDGILYFSGRLLSTGAVNAIEEVMFDLSPVTFCRPILDRYSPVAYAIMIEMHWAKVHHLSATTTYRESLATAYIIRGRDLAQEVRDSCKFCARYKAKLVEVEMGKIHESRLVIAPPFTYCQVDLLGPYEARCEHNHRAVVKVWGVVFKDPASGAVFVHAMQKYDTSAFVQAYTRFAARFGHPKKLFPDEGSQLIKACSSMELSWIDVSKTLNSKYGVGVEFEACPVGGHNYHGQVERSIREIKKLFDTVYKGVKLDLLGFETAFAFLSNELNNLPLCLGNKYRDLDNLDLITPNRLIQGRANKRAMSGPCTVDKPSKMLEKMHQVFEAWWQAWYKEKLTDFVVQPPKWLRSDPNLKVGDIVIFQKRGQEQVLGSPIWAVGRVEEADVSESDGKVRELVIQYRNPGESKFRTTRRAARSVALLSSEDDLDLMQELNAAARAADRTRAADEVYIDQQEAVARDMSRCGECVEPVACLKHSEYFAVRPYFYPEQHYDWSEAVESDEFYDQYSEEVAFLGQDCQEIQVNQHSLCKMMSIHSDPW
jgi:hypothetical protein